MQTSNKHEDIKRESKILFIIIFPKKVDCFLLILPHKYILNAPCYCLHLYKVFCFLIIACFIKLINKT